MKSQTSKKLVSFANKDLIDRLVKDEATINNLSESAVLEKHIVDSFLPKNKEARFWAATILYGDGENSGIGATLASIFNYNAAGTRGNWSSEHDNLLPIVKFAFSQQALCNTIPTGKELNLPYFRSQLDSVCSKLKILAEENTDIAKKHYFQNEANFAYNLLEEACDNPGYMRYSNFYKIVIDNWEELKDWSVTFRMLYALATMETGWHNAPETRIELLTILNRVSAEW